MSFIRFQAENILTAEEMMHNFRHINFGTPLLPQDFYGNPVDQTINAGDYSNRFRDSYFKNVVDCQNFIIQNSSGNNKDYIISRGSSSGAVWGNDVQLEKIYETGGISFISTDDGTSTSSGYNPYKKTVTIAKETLELSYKDLKNLLVFSTYYLYSTNSNLYSLSVTRRNFLSCHNDYERNLSFEGVFPDDDINDDSIADSVILNILSRTTFDVRGIHEIYIFKILE